ncbi:hypothetical protein K0M31_006876 [Melipona bicolor]|uniref:Uncharacterized protein n=1 Tax=Melipona bicolor TaxID=60889 RepID=A0AA40FSI0_9HYME|nr:hypothetical protein K0M31_006876 [Melipona bicolor]
MRSSNWFVYKNLQFVLETLETVCKLIEKRKQIEVFQTSQKSPKRKRQEEDHQLETASNSLVTCLSNSPIDA